MIAIIGSDQGSEFDAAVQIRKAVLRAWPWVEKDSNSFLYLIPNVQCHGENPRDIDLVILGSFSSENAQFHPITQLYFTDGKSVDADNILVRSLFVVLEIKEHSPSNVRFLGTKLEVRYANPKNPGKWHPATQQNEKQKYSLLNYLQRNSSQTTLPWITNLIWLRNVSRDDLPKTSHNVLPSTLTWTTLLNVIAINSNVVAEGEDIILTCLQNESLHSFSKVTEILTHKISPTNLDRKRMDRIANASIRESWLSDLGNKLTMFEGRGGTGKTVILLGLAWLLQRDQSQRVLFLTYNRALVSDLSRLLVLMGLTDEIGVPCIQVQTIHSFIYQLIEKLGLFSSDENEYLDSYDDLKNEIITLIRGGVLIDSDIQNLKEKSPDRFDWDYIFIDEAQDWFDDEKEILYTLFPLNHFVIADGHDQLIRRSINCDWTIDIPKKAVQRYNLQRGLRMKANLARFANSLAQEMGLVTWSIEENVEAAGGRILVVEGDYSKAQNIHSTIIEAARNVGNKPVDLLTCIPPSMVFRTNDDYENTIADLFSKWGYRVWDGVREDLRRTYPTFNEQLRIIQYESCRGLEGWSVFNVAIDDFYDYKLETWEQPTNVETIIDNEMLSHLFASRWIMIPCTRAIDTLIFNIRNKDTTFGKHLRVVANQHSDFVEWITV